RSSTNFGVLFCVNPIRNLSASLGGDLPFHALRDLAPVLPSYCHPALPVRGLLFISNGEELHHYLCPAGDDTVASVLHLRGFGVRRHPPKTSQTTFPVCSGNDLNCFA